MQSQAGLPCSRWLPADIVRDALAERGIEFRRRVFDPLVTWWAFLSQVLSSDHACRDAVARVLAGRRGRGAAPCSADDSSDCRASRRLPRELRPRLVRRTGRVVGETPRDWLWKGRCVKIADGTCDFRRGRWLDTRDHVVCWRRPAFHPQRFERAAYDQLPAEMWVRELRFRVQPRGFRSRDIVLVTTLLDAALSSREDLAGLSRERWHCELDLRSLKTTRPRNHLRCQTPEMVRQELWTHPPADHLIRQTILEAARVHQVLPRRWSFQGAVQTVNAFAPSWTSSPAAPLPLWSALLRAIAQHRVGDRPDRVEPRQVKRRRAEDPDLTQPRNPASIHLKRCA